MVYPNKGESILYTLITILSSSQTIVLTLPTYRYVPPVEYDSFQFNLDYQPRERLRKTIRFKQDKIHLLLKYFNLKSVKYRSRCRLISKFAIYLLLYKLLYLRPYFDLTKRFRRSPTYLLSVFNNVVKYLRNRYRPILSQYLIL